MNKTLAAKMYEGFKKIPLGDSITESMAKTAEEHYAPLVMAARSVMAALRDDELSTVIDEQAALDDLAGALDTLEEADGRP